MYRYLCLLDFWIAAPLKYALVVILALSKSSDATDAVGT